MAKQKRVPDGRAANPVHEAQDLAYEAERLLEAGDVRAATDMLDRVRALDPDCVEALILTAGVDEVGGRLADAERWLRRAVDVARRRLGGDESTRYAWWGEVITRPYMRARQALANLCWNQERYADALAEYRALLERNPRDNQGARYVIGPLCLMAGNLEEGLKEFEKLALNYKDEHGEPHHYYTWGLALFRSGRLGEALVLFRRGFFSNSSIAPIILRRDIGEPAKRPWSNIDGPVWARDYLRLYGRLWRETPAACEFLARAWDDPETRKDLDDIRERDRELEKAQDPSARKKILDRISKIEDRPWSDAFYARMDVPRPTVDPLHPVGQRDEPPSHPGEAGAGIPPGVKPVPYREAVKSGAFQALLDDMSTGLGDPMTKIGRAFSAFEFATDAELKEAMDRAIKAWNSARTRIMDEQPQGELDEGEDPAALLDEGLAHLQRGKIREALESWRDAVDIAPSMVDRLLLWDSPQLKENVDSFESREAWEYMNKRWWTAWQKDLRAWTALLVFWCRPDVQRAAGLSDDEFDEDVDLEGASRDVTRALEDPSPVGKLWRAVSGILHENAAFLRDLDAEGFEKNELPMREMEAIAGGTGTAQEAAWLLGRKEPTEKEAMDMLEAMTKIRNLLAESRQRFREITRASAEADSPRGVGRNDPCPCGSGRKFKKCCGTQQGP